MILATYTANSSKFICKMTKLTNQNFHGGYKLSYSSRKLFLKALLTRRTCFQALEVVKLEERSRMPPLMILPVFRHNHLCQYALVRWKWRVWLCCWSWLGGSGGYGCVAGLG